MPRLGSISVGTKILLALSMLCGLALFVGAAGHKGIQAMYERSRTTYERELQGISLSLRLQTAMASLAMAEKNYLLSFNNQQHARCLERYTALRREAAESLGALRGLGDTDASEAMTRRLFELAEEYWPLTQEVVDTGGSSVTAEKLGAIILSMGRASDKSGELIQAVSEHVAYRTAAADTLYRETAEEHRRTVAFMAAACLAAVVCTGVLVVALRRSIVVPLRQDMEFAESVSRGDLDARLPIRRGDEIGKLADALRAMVASLKAKIGEAEERGRDAAREAGLARAAMDEAVAAKARADRAMREGMLLSANQLDGVVARLTGLAGSLSGLAGQASAWAEEQRQGVEQTVLSMDQMSEAILDVARRAGKTADGAHLTRSKAQDGARVVGEVVAAIKGVQGQAEELRENMHTLGKEAEDIGQIIGVISDIADQTNLLALNAAIESARAGEAGRGFAVVADEVRKLAEKTMNATKQVGAAIRSIQERARSNMDKVQGTVQMIGHTSSMAVSSGQELRAIVAVAEESSAQVQAIASASEQQSVASDGIKDALDRISSLSGQTAQAMHDSTQAVQDLVEQSVVLRKLIETIQAA